MSPGMIKEVLQVLECFSPPAVLSEAELCARTGLPATVLVEVLALLEERGYLLVTPYGSYHLSPRAPFVPANALTESRHTHVPDCNPGGLGAFVVVDEDGIIRHVSEGFLHLWVCRDYGEVIGRSNLDIWCESEKVKGALLSLAESGSWAGVLLARRKDGESLPLDVAALTVRSGDRVMCSIFHASRRFGRAAGDCSCYREGGGLWMPDLLTRSMLHDMNNIWAVILGNVALLRVQLGKTDRDVDEMFADTESSCRLAFKMVHRIFDSPGIGVEGWQVVATGELINSAVRAGLSGTKLIRRVNLADDLAMIYCDESEIFRALLNVMVNARQAIKEDGHVDVSAHNVLIRAGEKAALAEGCYVKIVIADSGIGIPGDRLSRIFTPYFTTKETGTGLGLFVLSSTIRAHGGLVEVASVEGKGTDFTIYLPAVQNRS